MFCALVLCVAIVALMVGAHILGSKLSGYPPSLGTLTFGAVVAFIFLYCYHIAQQDETTHADSSRISPSHDEASMHVYFYDLDDNGAIVGDIWTHSVPDNDEKVILWNKEHGFRHYKVAYRIYGGNLEERTGAWNIYVKQSKPEQA